MKISYASKISGTFAAVAVATLIASSLSSSAYAATTPTAKPSAKPSIAGGQGRGAGGGAAADPARQAAFAKYQACLTATGVTFPQGQGFGNFPRGARPTGAPTGVRPTGAPTGVRPSQAPLTAAQQAALDKCASLRPQFGGGQFGARGGGADDNGGTQTLKPGAGTIIKKSATPAPTKAATTKATTTKTTNTTTAGTAYITCLNKAGVNVKTSADVSKLDQGSPKIAAALKSCASKK